MLLELFGEYNVLPIKLKIGHIALMTDTEVTGNACRVPGTFLEELHVSLFISRDAPSSYDDVNRCATFNAELKIASPSFPL